MNHKIIQYPIENGVKSTLLGSRWWQNSKCALGAILGLYFLYIGIGWLLNKPDTKLQAVDHAIPIANVPVHDYHKPVEPLQREKINKDAKMTTEADMEYIAKNLAISYEVISNLQEEDERPRYLAKITFTNTGTSPIESGRDWKIYFYSFRLIEPNAMKEDGVLTPNNMFIINFLNGLLYSLTPTKDFLGLEPGNSISITYRAGGANVARSSNLPNWYIAGPNSKARIIKSTEGVDADFVSSFDSPSKWKRNIHDMYEPLNPRERFDSNEMEDMEKAPIPIIPTPKEFQIDMEGGTVSFDKSKWVVVAKSDLQRQARYLADALGIKPSISQPTDCYIKLEVPSSANVLNDESYTLTVDPLKKTVMILGKSSGILYGIQSLLSLLDQYSGTLPKIHIEDSPRFAYRGLMVDVSRNFFPKDTIMQLLNVMATYKMNKFHFHLTDDEGWRIEIPSIPELTEVGGRRGHDLAEESFILPQLGSGPHPEGLGCGFYTVSDYKEILQYAADRNIEVIPEIDLPGHSHAAIKAVEFRRKRYLSKGEVAKANEFLLSDPEDKSKYRSVQGYSDNVVNPGMESTFTFINHVMKALKAMHENIQPLKTFHFGGDEVPTNVWSDSPACRKIKEHYPKVNVSNRASIMEYFLRRSTEIASKLGLNIQGWEDAFYVGPKTPHNRETFPSTIELITNTWKNVWEFGTSHHLYELANNGYKVIMSPSTHLYLDHPYEPDPEERGLYWATRFVDTKKVFAFEPDSFHDNIDVDISGKPMDKETACATGIVQCIPLEKTQNIQGIQAQIWTETVRTTEQLYEMLFPRLLAVAERAWYKAPWESVIDKHKKEKLKKKNYEQFSNTLGYKELEKLEKMGISFHLPLPGVRIENGMLKINTAHPGIKLQYSSDEGKTWQPLKSRAKLAGIIYIVTTSYDGSRHSRAVRVDIK